MSADGGLGSSSAPTNLDGDLGLATGFIPLSIEDCNENGIDDSCDVLLGGDSQDVQGNGIPDECEAAPSLSLNPMDFNSLGVLAPTTNGLADTSAGTLSFPGGTTYTGVVANGRSVFTFDSIDIPQGVKITAVGDRPLSLLSRSDLHWSGTLSAAGETLGGILGGPGGGSGGMSANDGVGPGGGQGSAPAGAGAGHEGAGGGALAAQGGSVYGGFQALTGGSGGGSTTTREGGGGGGAVELGATYRLTIGATGTLSVRGGNGQSSAGGGSGGMLLIHATYIDTAGTLDVRGGNGGFNAGSATFGGGGAGGGRITFDAAGASFSSSDFLLDGGFASGSGPQSESGEDGADGAFRWLQRAFVDCNQNGVPDSLDLAEGTSADADLDGVPDGCTTGAHFCSGKGS